MEGEEEPRETGEIRVQNHQNLFGIIKTDEESGEPLPGVEFQIWEKEDESGKQAFITDDQGRIQIEGWEPGVYRIQETKPLPGYVLDDTIHSFTVNEDGWILMEGEEEPRETGEIRVQNHQNLFGIIKTDEESGEPLPGVEFQIWEKEDESGKQAFITDDQGRIQIEGWEPGVYRIQETKPLPGYVLDDTIHSFTVNEDGWILMEGEEEPRETGEIRVQNHQNLFEIIKTDEESGEPLPGVEFQIWEKEDESGKQTFTTDDQGRIQIEGWEPGVYRIQETKPLPGYVLDDTIHSFTVNEDGWILMEGEEEPRETGEIRVQNHQNLFGIIKTDEESGEPLPGVEFQIWEKEDESGKQAFITDDQGRIQIEGWEPGVYRIQETKPLPGYVLDDTIHSFTVNEDGWILMEGEEEPRETGEIRVQNHQNLFEIIKTDEESGEPLPGVEFQIWEKEDESESRPLLQMTRAGSR